MSWLRFWKRGDDQASQQPGVTSTLSDERRLPPHLAAARPRSRDEQGQAPDRRERRLADLRRRRQAALFDIEQGELASLAENPWQQRNSLLTEAIATVDEDLGRLDDVPPNPYASLPETPITDVVVSDEQPPAVAFRVGSERFLFAEEIDWAERGHQVARGELRRREGDPGQLVPSTVPVELRDDLTAHLTESLFVFASDLRDRMLDGEPLPRHATLADLGQPCPTCGGWQDWRGRCRACARRNAERLQLRRERDRLLDERAAETEEQHRLAERLPIARRRLADIEIELKALESAGSHDRTRV